MGKEVNHNAPGDFAVDSGECMYIQHCQYFDPDTFHKVPGEEKSHVRRQPTNEDEKMRAMIAANACPFDAVTYKGSGRHPELRRYAEMVVSDPSLLDPKQRKDDPRGNINNTQQK